jgi:glutamyl-Q tRNA(Asp) synthetase
MGYRGRFAPSPTGPLHFGSLVAALGSFLDARSCGGEWLVRIEDLDRPREVVGAADQILRTLEAFGLEWDGEVAYQSRREPAYRGALADLERAGLLYACGCSRQDIRRHGRPGPEGPVYPGTCRGRPPAHRARRALRVVTVAEELGIEDRVQGLVSQNLERDSGDFVVQRADGQFAYQLAVVVDDGWQEVSHVVRGADLLLSAPRQAYLQRLLHLPRPTYAHLPVAVDAMGRKLSKQLASRPVDPLRPGPSLLAALSHLGQEIPPEPEEHPRDILAWAVARWDSGRIPATPALPVPPPSAPS